MHSDRIDSFFPEDEHFFGSYAAEHLAAEETLTPLEFDVDPRHVAAAQRVHFSRFRRPVAWVIGALAALSMAAFAQHGTRRDVGAHLGSVSVTPTPAAIEKAPAIAEVRRSSALATSVGRPSID